MSPSEPSPEPGGGPLRRGLLFDAFAVGDRFVSPARTVTEADIVAFAGLSGDYNPLHTDEEYARRTPFRGRVAHGLLIQAIASGLANQTSIFDGTIAAIEEMLIRYRAPVYPGDTLHVELEVVEKEPEPSPRRGWVRFAIRVLNQKDVLATDGEWRTLMHRRAPKVRKAVQR
jgi:acyl dehydratase